MEGTTTGGVSRRWALKAAGATGATAIRLVRAPVLRTPTTAREITTVNSTTVSSGRRHLENVGAVVGHPDPGAAAANGAGGQARPRGSGAGRNGRRTIRSTRSRSGTRDRPGSAGIRSARSCSSPTRTDTFRAVTYLNLAIYDATIASWAWKQHYQRRRPRDHRLKPAIDTPNSPSYPSEHGAAAGAAVGVLGHLYPDKATELAERAAEHAASRVAAGVEHPSDFEAGYALGKAVAAKVASARIDADGFGAPYPGDPNAPYPGGDGSYPILPKDEGFQIMIAEWTPLVIGDVTAFCPPPPPAKGSAERAAEVAEVKNYPRRKQPDFAELFFWAQDPDGRPKPDSGAFVQGCGGRRFITRSTSR